MEPNYYSPTWFEVFLATVPDDQTEREVDFVARQAPLPAFAALLDLCCGWGRHSCRLAARGYRVTGLDRDLAALAEARRRCGTAARFVAADLRDLTPLGEARFDAAVILWQSFGYFDDATNEAVLRQVVERLRPGGRLILDLYHRGFFARHQGERRFERGGLTVIETARLTGDRLAVRLDYGPAHAADAFEWRLYTPDEVATSAVQAGLRLLVACSGFDEVQPASGESARMQLVFERVGVGPR